MLNLNCCDGRDVQLENNGLGLLFGNREEYLGVMGVVATIIMLESVVRQ